MSVLDKIENAKEELNANDYRKVHYHLKRKVKKLTIRKRIWNWILQSKFVLAILMLSIGVSYTVCYYEGNRLYNQYNEAIGYWNDYNIRKTNKIEIINEVEAKTTELESRDSKKTSEDTRINGLVAHIYLNESSNGKNDDKCERIGKHNGYGFGQAEGKNFCTNSDDETRVLVEDWLKTKIEAGMNNNQILCYYNTGIVQESCKYLEITVHN